MKSTTVIIFIVILVGASTGVYKISFDEGLDRGYEIGYEEGNELARASPLCLRRVHVRLGNPAPPRIRKAVHSTAPAGLSCPLTC